MHLKTVKQLNCNNEKVQGIYQKSQMNPIFFKNY